MSAGQCARFDRFPDVLADDLFARNLFSRTERRGAGHRCGGGRGAHTLAALLASRRGSAGNAQLAADQAERLPGGREPHPWWKVVAAAALVPPRACSSP